MLGKSENTSDVKANALISLAAAAYKNLFHPSSSIPTKMLHTIAIQLLLSFFHDSFFSFVIRTIET